MCLSGPVDFIESAHRAVPALMLARKMGDARLGVGAAEGRERRFSDKQGIARSVGGSAGQVTKFSTARVRLHYALCANSFVCFLFHLQKKTKLSLI